MNPRKRDMPRTQAEAYELGKERGIEIASVVRYEGYGSPSGFIQACRQLDTEERRGNRSFIKVARSIDHSPVSYKLWDAFERGVNEGFTMIMEDWWSSL